MKRLKKSQIALIAAIAGGLFSSSCMAQGQILLCIPDTQMNGNTFYYYLPNTRTRLRCDNGDPKARYDLQGLYASGWTLVTMQQIDPSATGNKRIPPALYLQRILPDRK